MTLKPDNIYFIMYAKHHRKTIRQVMFVILYCAGVSAVASGIRRRSIENQNTCTNAPSTYYIGI